ncbi:hypothetical protein ElyMa_006713700 [Elysia marginata]|uniref:Syndecan/Neurexin domain-containing protein n=1 Tax=Elysia marginata TaxID=1093978 RepID=A0AAV4IRB2_9GAST|nr:hypothetical protein ElyMa_006713700 [Elysia marginata]
MDFAKDFTTAPPTSPTSTQAPPMPPRKTTPQMTTPTPITTTALSTTNTPRSNCHSSAAQSSPVQPPNWRSCQPLCSAHHMCPCESHLSSKVTAGGTQPCNCAQDCPVPTRSTNPTSSSGQFNSGQKGQKKSLSSNNVTIGSLVGAMLGALVLGLILGFVATRLYHVMRKVPDVRLVNGDDDLKY